MTDGTVSVGRTVHYRLGDIGLAFECEVGCDSSRMLRLCNQMFGLNCQRSGEHFSMRIRFCGRSVTENHQSQNEFGLGIFPADNGFVVRCGLSWLRIDASARRGNGRLDPDFWNAPAASQRQFLLLAVALLAREHGLFALHANAIVANDGRGFLASGRSGTGKTTLTAALLRAGWLFLADDAVLLRRKLSVIECLPFRRAASCNPDTAAWFPEVLNTNGTEGTQKVFVEPHRIAAVRWEHAATPRVIVFPEVLRESQSRLEGISQTAALSLLIRQSPGVFADRRSVEAQLEALRMLAGQCACYRILAGQDVFRDPDAVAQILLAA